VVFGGVLGMAGMDRMIRGVGVFLLAAGMMVAMVVVAVLAVVVFVAVVALTVVHVLRGVGVHRGWGRWGTARHGVAPVLARHWSW
jgi:hypothetical protein